jgi:5,10-methylenetetrahydrofolate reductase
MPDSPMIFEIIPPPTSWDSSKVMSWVHDVCSIMKREQLFYLNIPEVVDEESREGKRTVSFVKKMENIRFASIMRRECAGLQPIPNKIIVRLTQEEFHSWIASAYNKGIRNVVLIGGKSEKIVYPGLSVTEGAAYIKQQFPDVEVGGITIFTRPHEAERIIKKMESGITFFCSQIIFETGNLKQVLCELKSHCEVKNVSLPKIYVSLSPASELKDIAFIRWLGVEFPSAVYSYLTEPMADVEKRCIMVLERVVEELMDFMRHSDIELGFNIEHVRYTNLQLAEKLIQHIKRTCITETPRIREE